MPQWFTTLLTAVIPSLIVGVCTAIISVRLSLRRFHAERWWERKAEAYSRIVEALHNAMEYCSAMSNESLTGVEVSDDRKKQLDEAFSGAARELRKATGVGAYIISDEVAARCQLSKCPAISIPKTNSVTDKRAVRPPITPELVKCPVFAFWK